MTNAILDVLPADDFVLEADGKLKMNHANFTQALKAGFELKQKFPHLQVKVYEANDRTRRLTEER
jgi:hypothetical protein